MIFTSGAGITRDVAMRYQKLGLLPLSEFRKQAVYPGAGRTH